MNIEAGHPYGTVRLGALLMAASFAALVFLGASSPAVATSSPVSSESAGAIITQARAAMIRAGSVSAHGHGTTSLPGAGKATITEVDYTDATSGSQVVTAASGSAASVNLPSATTRDVAGAVYVNANAPFWKATVGMGTVPADQVAGQWVQIPRSSPAYAPAAADLTMTSLTQDMFHATSYHRGKIHMVDGQRVIAISYTNTGNDSGPVTCYVAVGGSHLPVLVTIGGLSLHLGSWGTTQTVLAPSEAVPLPDLNSSTASGLPVVA
jgi:hypothetical protein